MSFKILSKVLNVFLNHVYEQKDITFAIGLLQIGDVYYTEYTKEDNLRASSRKMIQARKTRYFLIENMKHHKLFKDINFWVVCLFYQILQSKYQYDNDLDSSMDMLQQQLNYKNCIIGNFVLVIKWMLDCGQQTAYISDFIMPYAEVCKLPGNDIDRLRQRLVDYESDKVNQKSDCSVF